jgi:hypothetical protein
VARRNFLALVGNSLTRFSRRFHHNVIFTGDFLHGLDSVNLFLIDQCALDNICWL